MASLCRPLSLCLRHKRISLPLHNRASPPSPSPHLNTQLFSSRRAASPPKLFSCSGNSSEIAHEFRFLRVYKDGRVEKFHETRKIPPYDDPISRVRSKDVLISPEPDHVSARVFLPEIRDPRSPKLPVLFYIHGGGFSFESAFSPHIHRYVSSVAAKAQALAVSVEYRLAPEHPIPACYEDSWAALQWVAAHGDGNGPDQWINEHADLTRVYLAGDSAGGNIAHDLAVRLGSSRLEGIGLAGMVLVHPYFGGTEDDAMWLYMCPANRGLGDPRLRPTAEDLRRVGCERALVFVAERDHLRGVGMRYGEELKKSGWGGRVVVVENVGEEHCFHLSDLERAEAVELVDRFASFIRQRGGSED